MGNINTSIVGFGLSGRYFFAPFIEYNSSFTLHSFVTSQEKEVYNEYSQAVVYGSVDEALNNDDIHLIVVASPNYTHFDYARKALLSGKHVVMEKPFTVTTEEAEQLIKLANDRNLVLAPFQNRRWDGDFLTIEDMNNAKALGEIVYFESHFDRYRPQYDRVEWKNEQLPGNGILYDLGPHLIDQALCLFGMPKEIFADIGILRTNGKVDDFFDIQLYYNELKVVLKAGVMVREQGPRFIVHGRTGSFIKYGLDPQEMNLRQGMKPENDKLGADHESYYGLIHTEKDGNIVREKVETVRGDYKKYFQ
ncbi:MAG TPA: Gfo/Idh/MocA family oxidoreductase, partial [Prolixibacteraceae bacterium]|nr:Gfo/Idh/MocA family oxidoreductase [Prolixibacteraceae bacterium]